ncbi:MAG: hypothetical protein JWM78_3424 [Verrucomicrobiaceae bacterium]|nr:hypothetical protein [Verrucomicrobiaceae bacterium]
MSKLLKFKACVDLEEASRRISDLIGEQITVDEIIYFAANGHVRLSVYADGLAGFIYKHKLGTPMPHPSTKDEPDKYFDGFYYLKYPSLDLSLDQPNIFDEGEFYGVGDDHERTPFGPILIGDDGLAYQCYKFSNARRYERPGLDLNIKYTDLIDFVAKVNGENCVDLTKLEKPIHVSEKRSISQIIAVLASMAKLDISSPYAADEVLRAEAARAGIDLPSSPETVVKFLKMATQSKLDK